MIVSAMCHRVNEGGATFPILLIIRPHYFYFRGELNALKQKLVVGGGCSLASVRNLVKYLTEAPKRFSGTSGTSGSICHTAPFGVIKSMFFFFACIFTANIFPPH